MERKATKGAQNVNNIDSICCHVLYRTPHAGVCRGPWDKVLIWIVINEHTGSCTCKGDPDEGVSWQPENNGTMPL